MPADEPAAFSVPEPIFEPGPEAEVLPVIEESPVGSSDEPRDPNAPPIPGAPPAAVPAAVQAPDAPERTPEELEAETARFRRPGSRGRRTPRQAASRKPSSRRQRKAAERAAASRPKAVADRADDDERSQAAHPPAAGASPTGRDELGARSRGVVASFSPLALLGAVVAVTLFTVLLAVSYRPGEGAWAILVAFVLVVVVQIVLLIGSVIVIRRKVRRRWGVLALVLLLVVNPVTAMAVGGLSTDRAGDGSSSAGGSGDEEHDPIWDTYPGSAYVDAKETLDGPSYEDFVGTSDEMLAEIRTALTAEFGFDWVERQPAETEVDQNGYGGDSMLFEYTAPVWQTTTTVRTFEEKSRVVELIRQVLLRYGIANLDMQNAPSSWREPGELTERYGGETLDTQALWDLHTYNAITGAGDFRTSIVDLTLDSAGTVAKDREFDVDYYDMAAEGIELHLDSYALLKEADRADYLEALKPYADLDKPK
ncbi:hypothetical protein [Plantibacter sp. VKM Ac-2876]|uniref:hypothetical protein n=1 Tax=Plantibacter sp. VKM Ac-2876 TaxID=2783826 RepID=UPI001E2C1128|nr:hypothetical protein [Plantibacter sp. VKM Ac-2876]